MNRNCLLNRPVSISQIILLSGLFVCAAAAPGSARPQPSHSPALMELSTDSANGLGEALEMNCEIATRRGITLFYTTVNGEQVPIDCLSLLRPPGERRVFGPFDPAPYRQAEDEINGNLNDLRNPDSIQIPLVRVEF